VKASAPVTQIDAARVAAAFAKGVPLLEVDGYKIHASRREGPGMAEVHDWETDVVYVLEGSATVITGGTVIDPKVTEPGQVRGPVTEGGESRRIAKGDVIVIPAGVPHWFKDVQGPLTYFVVKPIVRN
jgi:glc operon protein GlcG